MTVKVETIVGQFVSLVFSINWNGSVVLSEDGIQTLFLLVNAAGFQPKEVVPGKLEGRYVDTNNAYPINSLCFYKVVDQADGDNYRATGWLDCIVKRVNSRANGDRIALIKEIEREVERSVPLQPIQLTVDGDELLEDPKDGYLVDHTRDDHKLGSCVGIHAYCKGWMDRRPATVVFDAILCRGCYLRVLFPREVVTYGELRFYLSEYIAEKRRLSLTQGKN